MKASVWERKILANMKKLRLEERLGLDSFSPDQEPFITVETEICKRCEKKPCLYACPAGVYIWENEGLVYNTEGCLEMGVCTIVCHSIGAGAIRWKYPRGGFGVKFKYG